MKTGIIGAMEAEVALLKEQMGDYEVVHIANMDFCAGKLGAADAVVVQCGIGKVNAGICVQILADRFGVDRVINTGVAGSLDPTIDVGDLVVSTECVMHDFSVEPLGYAPGQVPGIDTLAFTADEGMRSQVVAAAAKVAPDICVFEGRVASGDQFISTDGQRERIVSVFGGRCCEMEGCAVAQAAYLNDLPFVVVRAISDKPGSADQVVDYNTFEAKAARNCAAIVAKMVAGE
ncbi:5'-methylthioadenosine/adenosylhomocysteine nucleosidase [Paratractidigestivibacter sp.]|uniref:5'-methylthioadenosine/adenosylhomocysteine nucleosidase n=1 Tax=Paratractidigestivibacter sp. TaxID=2847316 RepID=UPI002ABE4489|nr:5'-methylthioadenosine/adenosylhomocysteine nucleosidase [Paratractidigestivibacter sp.]